MADIVIGKARVIGVEEVSLDPPKQAGGALGALAGNQYVNKHGLSPVEHSLSPSGKPPRRSMIISRLMIEPAGKTEGYTAIEGVMVYPGQLPFGKTFELTLHEMDNVMEGNDRLFKDGE
jgi:hypothetical protein